MHASRRDRDRGLGIVGKIAVITGAGRGIGRATAILFARWGARVVAVAIDPDLLEALAEAIQGIGGEAEMAVADVCAHDSPCHPICQALDASRAGEYFPFASPGKSEYKIPSGGGPERLGHRPACRRKERGYNGFMAARIP